MIGDEHTFSAAPGTREYDIYKRAWDFGLRIRWEDDDGAVHWGRVYSMGRELDEDVWMFKVQEVGEGG